MLLDPLAVPRLIVASDASQDKPRQGRAGVLLVGPSGDRVGAFFDASEAVFQLWNRAVGVVSCLPWTLYLFRSVPELQSCLVHRQRCSVAVVNQRQR